MNGKTGWFCYAKKSGCDILYKKMKSKNVSLAVEIYPREGTETVRLPRPLQDHALKFIPVRGRKQCVTCLFLQGRDVEIYPREGTETLFAGISVKKIIVEIYPREGTETCWRMLPTASWRGVEIYPREGTETALPPNQQEPSQGLKFIPVRGRKLTGSTIYGDSVELKFIPVRGRKPLTRGTLIL